MSSKISRLYQRWLETFVGSSLFVDNERKTIYTEIGNIRYEIGLDGNIRVYFPFDALERKVHLAMKEERVKEFIKTTFQIRPFGLSIPIFKQILFTIPDQCNLYLEFIRKVSKELMEFFLEEKVKTLMIAKALKGK